MIDISKIILHEILLFDYLGIYHKIFYHLFMIDISKIIVHEIVLFYYLGIYHKIFYHCGGWL